MNFISIVAFASTGIRTFASRISCGTTEQSTAALIVVVDAGEDTTIENAVASLVPAVPAIRKDTPPIQPGFNGRTGDEPVVEAPLPLLPK